MITAISHNVCISHPYPRSSRSFLSSIRFRQWHIVSFEKKIKQRRCCLQKKASSNLSSEKFAFDNKALRENCALGSKVDKLAKPVADVRSGCLFVPSIAVLPMYFVKNRALSMGVAASGASIGEYSTPILALISKKWAESLISYKLSGRLICPVIFRRLEPQLGFPWATRIIAFIILAVLAIPMGIMKLPRGATASRPDWRVDMSVWKE